MLSSRRFALFPLTASSVSRADAVTDIPEWVLGWAAAAVGAQGAVVHVQTLRAESGTSLIRIDHRSGTTEAILKCGPPNDWRGSFACEAAALEVGTAHGLPVPRVLGSRLDTDPVALLMTRLLGTAAVPLEASAARLRELGRTAAAVHRIPLEPTRELPRRERHTAWCDYALWRRLAARMRSAGGTTDTLLDELPGWSADDAVEMLQRMTSTDLLDEADERVRSVPPPATESVFVHGDLWQGNTLWDGDACVGVIDWETAGAGHPGVDIGCLRWDAAVLFGDAAADEILAGWEDASGRRAAALAYWDVVAALNTPADMGDFLRSFAEAGRGDLDADTVNRRRDAFLSDALKRLDRGTMDS